MKKFLIVAIVLVLAVFVGREIRSWHERRQIIRTTSPPTELMMKNLEEQMACAEKAGFMIKKPILRIMKPGPYLGYAYLDYNIITLVSYATHETMAHELGHMVDAQTKRKGHPYFKGKENWDSQSFADAIKVKILEECKVWPYKR